MFGIDNMLDYQNHCDPKSVILLDNVKITTHMGVESPLYLYLFYE